MKNIVRLVVVSVAVVLASMPKASGQDVVKVAGAQYGVWETAAVELGQRAGIFKKNGIELELLYLDDVKEIIQSVIVGGADIGLAVGIISAIQAYVFGAPIRIIGASMAGSANYWYAPQSSPIRTLKDLAGKTVAYERNGSSSHYDAIDFTRNLRPRARLVATGGAAATFDRLNAGNIDVGWANPPFGIDKIDQGAIRVVGRANDMPQIRNKTVGVIIAQAAALQQRKDVLVRFLLAYRETVEWMYSDPAALQRFAEIAGMSEAVVKRLRDEFFPKESLLPDRIVGLKEVMRDAVALDYIQKQLSRKQIAELFQIMTPEHGGGRPLFRRLRNWLRER